MIALIKSTIEKLLGKESNPYFKKLRKVLKQQSRINVYDRITFLGGFRYEATDYSKVKDLIKQGKLYQLLNDLKYDVQSDNIELYYFENTKEKQNFILVLLDSYELYANEQILDIFEVPQIHVQDLRTEIIYTKE